MGLPSRGISENTRELLPEMLVSRLWWSCCLGVEVEVGVKDKAGFVSLACLL